MKIRMGIGIAFAVVAAAVICIFAFGTPGGDKDNKSGEIRVFENYGQIEKTLSEIREEPMVYANGVIDDTLDGGMGMVEDAEVYGGNAAADKDAERSDTYVQVEGVDEADIIKTDGKYIYYTSRLGYDVIIARVNDGKAEDAALISEEEMGIAADDMFLTGDRLVIVGYEQETSDNDYIPVMSMNTAACVYDVSDPEKP